MLHACGDSCFLLPESYFAEQVGLRYDPEAGAWQPPDSADWWKR